MTGVQTCALPISLIIVDPGNQIKSKRKAVILYLGFHVHFEDRLGIAIQGDTSPNLFTHYYDQANYLFNYSSKIILIVDISQSGKTTMIKKLIENVSLEKRSCIFSIISQSVWRGNRQIGYEVITNTEPAPRLFAVRRNNGSYEIDEEVLISITQELEQAYLDNKIIVIDEIGEIQTSNAGFSRTIEKIINDPSATMFASLPLNHKNNGFFERLKLHYRTTVVTLASEARERNEIERMLVQEMEASLQLFSYNTPTSKH